MLSKRIRIFLALSLLLCSLGVTSCGNKEQATPAPLAPPAPPASTPASTPSVLSPNFEDVPGTPLRNMERDRRNAILAQIDSKLIGSGTATLKAKASQDYLMEQDARAGVTLRKLPANPPEPLETENPTYQVQGNGSLSGGRGLSIDFYQFGTMNSFTFVYEFIASEYGIFLQATDAVALFELNSYGTMELMKVSTQGGPVQWFRFEEPQGFYAPWQGNGLSQQRLHVVSRTLVTTMVNPQHQQLPKVQTNPFGIAK